MDAALKSKIEHHFGRMAVDKRQALQAGFELMPRFVTEYLLAAARDRNGALDVHDVRDRIRRFSVDADRRGEFVSRLMRDKEARLIAHLEVDPRPDRNEHVGRLMQLDGHELNISDSLVGKYPELLYGGLWGTCALFYDTQGFRPRIVVTDFSPYQLTRPDMDLLCKVRKEFSLDEWIQLLLQSAGYRPEAFPTLRQKLLVLSRLVPLAQGNVNLIELGPRGTGKSYLLRNLSSRTYLLSGARATPASLLYDLNRRAVGMVGRRKVVVFDEVGATSFPDVSLVAALKDYMESGNIARGGRSMTGDCSLVFTGNIDLESDGLTPRRDYLHLFEVLPYELCDSAVADRFHAFIPGWELPKISDDVLADGVGLLGDYFGEVLCELRKDLAFDDYVKTLTFEGTTRRDRVAIEKMSAGLLKILFPDGQVDETGLTHVLTTAVEMRLRVHAQLERMAPGEYRSKTMSFAGMLPITAPDLSPSTHLEEHDVEANQQELVGKVTLLFVSDRGGGDVGFVECALIDGGGLGITGLRGEVLEQSVRAAYNALLNLGDGLGLNLEVLRKKRMTMHLVNIAEPKDGPSAGVAFALAMVSAATGRRVMRSLAVTGELSLHGNISGVGGVTEKVQAARRHGRTSILIPSANAAELARAVDVASALDIHPVRTLKEAVDVALRPLAS